MRAFTKSFLPALFASVCLGASAQQQVNFDDTPSGKFGFLFGGNRTIPFNNTKGQFGFTSGITAEYPLTKKIFFNPQPSLTFIAYKIPDNGNADFVELTLIEFPLHLMIKLCGSRTKPVFALGPNYKHDWAAKESYWGFDIAMGIEKQLEYCTIAPALRFSYGKEIQAFYLSVSFKN